MLLCRTGQGGLKEDIYKEVSEVEIEDSDSSLKENLESESTTRQRKISSSHIFFFQTNIKSTTMKFPAVLLAAGMLVATSVSAYRIDLYSDYDYQGDQATFVRLLLPLPPLSIIAGSYCAFWNPRG